MNVFYCLTSTHRNQELFVHCNYSLKQRIPSFKFKRPPTDLDVFLDPLNSRLECTFLASLYFGITQIAPDSKSMSTSVKIFPLVAWCELATSKDLIGFNRCLIWK